LHSEAHVETTYKRALPRKSLGRDYLVSGGPGNLTAFRRVLNYNKLRRQLTEEMMRRPRDFDAELKALEDKARALKTRKVRQLGELVIATGADMLTANELAGALIVIAEIKEAGKKEAWSRRGATFFQGRPRRTKPATDRDTGGAPAQPGGAQPPSGRRGAT
jgi:hypothetical protein